MVVQLDLFGEVLATEAEELVANRTRLRDGLTCLADSCPNTLGILLGARDLHRGEVKAGKTGQWAYAAHRDGFYFEHVSTWGGWYSKPRHRITWEELDAITASDWRMPRVRAWEAALTASDAWRDRTRPFELWPDPEGWHDHYLEMDHARAGWTERYQAWRSVIDICRHAATRAEAGWTS